MRVAICLITCRRPRWLAGSLESLSRLLIDEETAEIGVIVVDNDPDGSGRDVVLAAGEGSRWPLSYEIEPQRGIPFARNRAVHLARAWDAAFVAFLDDDETASPAWLAELLAAQQQHDADVVSGPVVPSYEPGVAEWVRRGRFFERPRHRSGTLLRGAITANCLISSHLLSGSAEPFHPAFGLNGGDDTHFFRRAHREGAKIVWADRAIVHERVPESRATTRWLLQRAFRGGTSYTLSERLLHRTRLWILVRACTGTVRSLQGLVLLLPSLFQGKAGMVRALQVSCVGAGLLAGTLGIVYQEYKVIHGE